MYDISVSCRHGFPSLLNCESALEAALTFSSSCELCELCYCFGSSSLSTLFTSCPKPNDRVTFPLELAKKTLSLNPLNACVGTGTSPYDLPGESVDVSELDVASDMRGSHHVL